MSSKIASTFGRYEVVRVSGAVIGIKLLSLGQTGRLLLYTLKYTLRTGHVQISLVFRIAIKRTENTKWVRHRTTVGRT